MTPESRIVVNQDGAVIDSVGGFENEYGATATARNANGTWPINPGSLLYVAYASNDGANIYGEEGDRRYVDVGDHPEYCTPEDDIFLLAAYRTLRGHHVIAADLQAGADKLISSKDNNITDIALKLYANIVDYKGGVWGRHNNTLAPRALEPQDYIPAFVAHRSSRIVWSGAGYVRSPNGNPKNVQPCLSERAEFIRYEAGIEDTKNRALVHLRDEPLCDGELYRRIHDTAGESVFAPNVNALILATEVLIARACGLGIKYDDLKPENGPEAMRDISRDISLQESVRVGEKGVRYTGVQLQYEIAARTLGALSAAKLLTEQDKRYEALWLDYVDKLEHGQFMTGENNELYLFDWTPKLEQIDMSARRPNKKWSPIEIAQILASNYHQILPKPGKGMQLLQEGKFADSPSQEILEHGPPLAETRAKLRGDAIRRLNRRHIQYRVDWLHLQLDDYRKSLILRDPFAAEDGRVESLLQSVGA